MLAARARCLLNEVPTLPVGAAPAFRFHLHDSVCLPDRWAPVRRGEFLSKKRSGDRLTSAEYRLQGRPASGTRRGGQTSAERNGMAGERVTIESDGPTMIFGGPYSNLQAAEAA